MEMIKLSEITEFIERRKVNKSGVELLTKSIKENGFLINNPVVIVPIHGGKYKLIDGKRRNCRQSTILSKINNIYEGRI